MVAQAEPFPRVQSWCYSSKLSYLFVRIASFAAFCNWALTAGGVFKATALTVFFVKTAA